MRTVVKWHVGFTDPRRVCGELLIASVIPHHSVIRLEQLPRPELATNGRLMCNSQLVLAPQATFRHYRARRWLWVTNVPCRFPLGQLGLCRWHTPELRSLTESLDDFCHQIAGQAVWRGGRLLARRVTTEREAL